MAPLFSRFSACLLLLIAATYAPFVVVSAEESAQQSTSSTAAACPQVKAVENRGYHSDANCDRSYFNKYKDSLRRESMHASLKAQGAARVPNQKTVTCPAQPTDLANDDTNNNAANIQGYDTVWIVENTATTPVILGYLKEGVEYSAVNSKITPPEMDPAALLKPGEWKAVYTYDGHVFHARELLETGKPGRVVLQHRTGLIPVGVGTQELDCPLADAEPIVGSMLAPAFQRTPPTYNRKCNHIDVGFRNQANCPLNGYYIPHEQPAKESCVKNFQFHLGTAIDAPDFHWDWQSNTKFEGTAVGHSFAFYSAAHPEMLVDTVTIEPTRIIDCPREQEQEVQVQVGVKNSIVVPVRSRGYQNATSYHNSTTDIYLDENESANAVRYMATMAGQSF